MLFETRLVLPHTTPAANPGYDRSASICRMQDVVS